MKFLSIIFGEGFFMIKIKFSDEDIRIFNHERYHHSHPFVRQKMEALWLKSNGMKHKEICHLANICPTTLRNYLLEYKEGGVSKIMVTNFYKPKSSLEDYRDILEAHFRENPPANSTIAMAEIEKLTGLQRSPERVRVFLKKIGMQCRKVGAIPAKADLEAQENFKKKSLNPA